MSAAEELAAAAVAALRAIDGLGIYDGPPVQAVAPYAIVETGPEIDWSHKSGAGRELRLAVTLRDKGERPERIRRMAAAAEAAVAGIGQDLGAWRVVTLRFQRSRLIRDRSGEWVGVMEFRARVLAE
jgi:hypothetical protein